MENLNKENLFNELMNTCPRAMQDFCNFIDEYKKSVNWNSLFDFKQEFHVNPDKMQVKFHDIPLAMQFGIIVTWLCRHLDQHELEIRFPATPNFREYFVQDMHAYFAIVDNMLEPDEAQPRKPLNPLMLSENESPDYYLDVLKAEHERVADVCKDLCARSTTGTMCAGVCALKFGSQVILGQATPAVWPLDKLGRPELHISSIQVAVNAKILEEPKCKMCDDTKWLQPCVAEDPTPCPQCSINSQGI